MAWLHTAQPSFQLQDNFHQVTTQLGSAAMNTYRRPDSPSEEAMAAECIFTAPPHFFDAGPPVPCPGPYRPLSAAELDAPVAGASSPAWTAAPDAAVSADAGTSGFSDADEEQDFDEDAPYDNKTSEAKGKVSMAGPQGPRLQPLPFSTARPPP